MLLSGLLFLVVLLLTIRPDSMLARAWLGVCLVLEAHYAAGVRMLLSVANRDSGDSDSDIDSAAEAGAQSMASAFLDLPECVPYARAARAARNAGHNDAQDAHGAVFLSTNSRLTFRAGH